MAGSEVSGVEGARASLFMGAHWILCPNENTDPEAFARLHEFVTALGARSISLPVAEHDNAIAIVSHVPHIMAGALVQLAGSHAGANRELFRLAAGGFKDTTRIAAGSPELWSGITLDNRAAVLAGLRELRQIITGFETSIRQRDARALTRQLAAAAALRASIPASWVADSARLVEMRIPLANQAGAIARVTGFAGKAACNIQSIDIDHINEDSAILVLILTDEGDIDLLHKTLLENDFDVTLGPVLPRE
jgi:prephenate dehydrogenase